MQVQIEKCCKKIFKKLAMPLNLSLQIMLFKFTREMTINKYEGTWKTGTVELTKEDSDSSSTESEKAKQQTPSKQDAAKKRKDVHAKTPSPKTASKPAKNSEGVQDSEQEIEVLEGAQD